MVEILAAHRIPYAATAGIAYPEDMIQKFEKTRRMRGGTRFLHVFATCPKGWRIPSEMSVKIARLAVQTNVFPLYEVTDGVNYIINTKGQRPVSDYLKVQGRFKHLTDDDIDRLQNLVDENWGEPLLKTSRTQQAIDQFDILLNFLIKSRLSYKKYGGKNPERAGIDV